jgi:hypothetical protein
MKTPMLAILFLLSSSLVIPAQSMFDKVNDFDGDGKADYAVTRNENGQKIWYLLRSTEGFAALAWGLTDDIVVAGDYDGDNRTDIAVARLGITGNNNRLNTTYFLSSATGGVGIVQADAINSAGTLSFPNQDYDGDGRTDPAIFQWHAIGGVAYRASSTGTLNHVSMSHFQVRTGDLTGDNAAEVVSHDPGSGEFTVVGHYTLRFGSPGDRVIAADFDGDNKGDFAVFRPATGDWWWLRSSDSVVSVTHWGVNGDIPVPADYDNDGVTDLAVYRPASPQSIFYVLGSTAGFSALGFGVETDSVVTY